MKGRDPGQVPTLNAKVRKGSVVLYLDKNQVTRWLELHSYLWEVRREIPIPSTTEMISAIAISQPRVSPWFCTIRLHPPQPLWGEGELPAFTPSFCHYGPLFCEWSIKPAIMSWWRFILPARGLCLLQHNEFLWFEFRNVVLYNRRPVPELQFSTPAFLTYLNPFSA